MLTEKCPYCGSYNDINAATCYFCHKELPDVPGQKKKKRKPKAEEEKPIRLPPSLVSTKRKSPPGCLVGFVAFLFLACTVVIFQWVNSTYQLINWKIPLPSSNVGQYTAYYLAQLAEQIDALTEYPIIIIASILLLAILSWGLLNLKPWARALVLMLLIILLIANFALFVTFVMHFYYTPVNGVSFILILLGIIVNIYFLMWFFERKKLFE
jgi:hypothetical protein